MKEMEMENNNVLIEPISLDQSWIEAIWEITQRQADAYGAPISILEGLSKEEIEEKVLPLEDQT